MTERATVGWFEASESTSEPLLDASSIRLEHQAERGLVLAEAGDSVAARATLDSARVNLEVALAGDTTHFYLAKLAVVYAGLGRRDAAVVAARRAVALAEGKGGALSVSSERRKLALVQTLLGEEDAAISTLETYLAEPGIRSFRCVATHPIFRRLRDRPGFDVCFVRAESHGATEVIEI